MTARLSVLLEPRPVEQVEADVVVVAYGATDPPLRGPAARIDWRLCGRLSVLLRDTELCGRAGEAALLPGGGGVRASLVVALGLGESRALDAAGCRALAHEAVERAVKLGARSLALPLATGAEAPPTPDRMGATVDGAAAALAQQAGERELSLRIVAAPEDQPAVAEWLHRAPRSSMPDSVELHLPPTSGSRQKPPPPGRTPSPPLRPLVK